MENKIRVRQHFVIFTLFHSRYNIMSNFTKLMEADSVL